MLNNKDKAIKENVLKPHTIATFKKNTLIDADCHIWQGFKTKKGYGYFSVYSKEVGTRLSVKAHRFAYAMANGFDKLPMSPEVNSLEALVINHICHNKSCVNPDHLEVITARENLSPEKMPSKNA
jgi:hypothetical protein